MVTDEGTIKQVLSQIDRDELVRLAMELINIPSPTGKEKDLAQFILDWFSANGFLVVRQEIEDERLNAIGMVKGLGQGPSLMINGHLDTAMTGTAEDLLLMKEIIPELKPKGFVKDGKVCGLGAGNMKGGIASFMIAGKALIKSGIRLKGDLILAAVAGEISVAPIGPYQGSRYHAEGTGTRYLLAHGVQSDYAIVADGSGLALTNAQAGVAYVKLSVFGEPVYTPFTQRAKNPLEGSNAAVKMAAVIPAIEAWGAEYEQKNRYIFPGGVVVPKVNIGAIEAGFPYRPSRSPGICNLYIDVRTPPGKNPLEIKYELEKVLNKLAVEYEILLYRSQRGYEGKENEELIRTIHEVYQYLFQTEPPAVSPPVASMWTDTNIYNEMGIPVIKCGPSRLSREGPALLAENEIEIEELVKAARLYAVAALELCSRKKT